MKERERERGMLFRAFIGFGGGLVGYIIDLCSFCNGFDEVFFFCKERVDDHESY